jgi:hypothetical protein
MQEFAFIFSNSSLNDISVKVEDYFSELYADAQIINSQANNFVFVGLKDASSSIFNKVLKSAESKSLVYVLGEPNLNGKPIQSEDVFLQIAGGGINLIKTMDGDFVIVVYNDQNHQMDIITSKLGLIPAFLFLDNNRLILSSRLGFIQKIQKQKGINKGALLQYCIYNYCISDNTVFNDVVQLPSASFIQINNFIKKKETKYWTVLDEMNSRPLKRKDSLALINHSLEGIIHDILRNQDKCAISLTGGWDGRLILAYALKYKSASDILLYSFGTKDSPDVYLPEKTSKKLGFEYLPVFLDSDAYQDQIVNWANRTAFFSDGMRSVKRSHYLYAMDMLSNRTNLVISGNGGSNLIKSTKLTFSNVFNKYVLELMSTDNPDETASQHYRIMKEKYAPLFDDFSEDDFIHSLHSNDLIWLYSNIEKEKRLIVFLTGDIERKYFGIEAHSYKHLVKNISPFFDMRFIRDLAKTLFFGGYDDDPGKLAGLKNARFYARLVYNNNKKLSKELTDRGFSLYDLLFPVNPMILINYRKAKGAGKKTKLDYFHNKDLTNKIVNDSFPSKKKLLEGIPQDEIVSNYITFLSFMKQLN